MNGAIASPLASANPAAAPEAPTRRATPRRRSSPCSAACSTCATAPAFEAACPGTELRYADALGAPERIDAAVCWYPPPGLLATLPRLRPVQSLAAGIDHLPAGRRGARRCCAASSTPWPAAWPPMWPGR